MTCERLIERPEDAEATDLEGKAGRPLALAGPANTVVGATGLGASAIACISFETPQTVIEGSPLRGGDLR